MNIKEKILFISSVEFVEKLNEQNFDYDNHNRLFWCHLAALSFITSGVSEFHLDLTYNYLLFSSNLETKEIGVKINLKSLSFYTTKNSLIDFSNSCTRSALFLNNPIFGRLRCFQFKEKMEKYININIKYPEINFKEFNNTTFNTLFLKLKIHNRKAEESQIKFIQLLTEQCPEINYLLNYFHIKENLSQNNFSSNKKVKI